MSAPVPAFSLDFRRTFREAALGEKSGLSGLLGLTRLPPVDFLATPRLGGVLPDLGEQGGGRVGRQGGRMTSW